MYLHKIYFQINKKRMEIDNILPEVSCRTVYIASRINYMTKIQMSFRLLLSIKWTICAVIWKQWSFSKINVHKQVPKCCGNSHTNCQTNSLHFNPKNFLNKHNSKIYNFNTIPHKLRKIDRSIQRRSTLLRSYNKKLLTE